MRRLALTGLLALLALAVPAAPASAEWWWPGGFGRATVDSWEGGEETDAKLAGDLNGDGLDEILLSGGPAGAALSERHVTVKAGREYDTFDWSESTRAATTLDMVAPVGDLDRDGLDDLAITEADGTVTVALSTEDEGRLSPEWPDSLRIVGVGTTAARGADRVVPVGDANGDGRPDLAIGATGLVRVLFLPARLQGEVIDASVEAHADVTTPEIPAGVMLSRSVRGGAGRELVIRSAPGDPEPRIVGLTAPGEPGERSLDSLVRAGRAWEARVDGPLRKVVPVGDYDRDGGADLAVVTNAGARVATPPAPGSRGALAGGFALPDVSAAVVDVGDQDMDGTPDLALDDELAFVRPEAPWRTWSRQTIAPDYFASETLAAVADIDRDRRRDVLTHVWLEQYHYAEVMTSGALAVARQGPGTWRGSDAPPGPSPCDTEACRAIVRNYQAGVERALAEARDRVVRPRRWATEPGLASTPEYRDGTVNVRAQLPRRATIVGTPEAAEWVTGSTIAVLGSVTATALPQEPWAALGIVLPPHLRAALERDGRLRVRMRAVITTAGRQEREVQLSFVVVTQRAAPVPFGKRRTLRGGFGPQQLVGGELSELLTGASGNDVLRGGGGVDALIGGSGNDQLLGEAGDDVLDGVDGDDRLFGGPGNDNLVESRFGDDLLDGGPGDDVLRGLRGHDALHGGAGDDVISGGSGPDEVFCGPGEDVVFVNFGSERKRIHDCEHVYEEPGVVNLVCATGGTDGPETVLGTEGADVCEGRGGDDDVEGRGGDDVLRGGAGADRIFGRFGADVLEGGDGNDEIEGGRGTDRLDGGPGNDRLNGGYDVDVVLGGPGDDRVTARGGGADRIDCGPGARDVAIVDSQDRVTGCERVDRSGARRRR